MGVCSQVFWRHRGSFLGCKVSSFIPYPHTVTFFQVLLNSHLSYCLKCIFDHVRATGENTPVASRLSSASCCRKLSITGPQRSLEEYPVPHTAVQSQQTVERTQCSWLHPPAHLSILLHAAWTIFHCLPRKLLVLPLTRGILLMELFLIYPYFYVPFEHCLQLEAPDWEPVFNSNSYFFFL